MLKKIAITFIILLIPVLYITLKDEGQVKIPWAEEPVSSPTSPDNPNTIDLVVKNNPVRAIWTEINSQNLILIPNFKEKKNSSDVNQEYHCKVMTSAGFYTQDDKPVGLFVSDGQLLRKENANALFNGFVTIDTNKNIFITKSVPDTTIQDAIQTGPFFLSYGNFETLKIKGDEPARRVAALIDTYGKLYLAIFFTENSKFNGPLLGDMPEVIQHFANSSKIQIIHAINLDGGSASTFYKGDIQMAELTHVGAFFCQK